MPRVELAIFDDHPIFLEGQAGIFADSDEFAVVEKGVSASDAINLTLKNRPDVILLDLDMPGNILQAIQKIREEAPDVRVLIFTASMAVEHAVQVLEAGAHGYVIKGSTAAELAEAIRAVMRGETFVTHTFAAKVIAALQNASLRKRTLQAIRLNMREEQIVRLLLRGRTNKEIGQQLQISEKTVKHYMSILMQKLHARNRLEVVLAAQKLQAEVAPGSNLYLQ